jgi:hypothetical protein
MRDFILCSLETASENPDLFETGKSTFAFQQNMLGGDWSKAVSEMSSVAVMLAGMGVDEGFKQLHKIKACCLRFRLYSRRSQKKHDSGNVVSTDNINWTTVITKISYARSKAMSHKSSLLQQPQPDLSKLKALTCE